LFPSILEAEKVGIQKIASTLLIDSLFHPEGGVD
jgi:hypothetical protein